MSGAWVILRPSFTSSHDEGFRIRTSVLDRQNLCAEVLNFRPSAESGAGAADQQGERAGHDFDDLRSRMENEADEDRPRKRNQGQVPDRSGEPAAGAFGRETHIQVERRTLENICRSMVIKSPHRRLLLLFSRLGLRHFYLVKLTYCIVPSWGHTPLVTIHLPEQFFK